MCVLQTRLCECRHKVSMRETLASRHTTSGDMKTDMTGSGGWLNSLWSCLDSQIYLQLIFRPPRNFSCFKSAIVSAVQIHSYWSMLVSSIAQTPSDDNILSLCPQYRCTSAGRNSCTATPRTGISALLSRCALTASTLLELQVLRQEGW
jgi:hypothetical protein